MKKERLFELLAHTDEQLIARAEARRANRSGFWRISILAACLALVVLTMFMLPSLITSNPAPDTPTEEASDAPTEETLTQGPTQSEPQTESTLPPTVIPDPGLSYMPDPVGALSAPDALGASGLEFLHGSSSSLSGDAAAEPPAFEFSPTGIAVRAKVIESLPDTYYKLDVDSTRKPTPYRLIKMQTLEVLHGENIPDTFFYLIPQYTFVDMSVYDCLYISMIQIGLPQYVLRNGTQNTVQAFDLPVFSDKWETPMLGNIIAFTDGVFDESLWQYESWIYGYQFAKFALDDPASHPPLVVYRGYTEQQTKDAIIKEIAEYREWCGESYRVPALLCIQQPSQAVQEALAYVSPFENGVFSQSIRNSSLLYRRYINGVQTEETVRIDLNSQEVTYSDVRYTAKDLDYMENIAPRLSELAASYQAQFPAPPRVDTSDKQLFSLSLYGWYVKTEQGIYGIIKTVWMYRNESDWTFMYYDDDYTLYDAQNAKIYEHLTPQEVFEITQDMRNVYSGDYSPKEISI